MILNTALKTIGSCLVYALVIMGFTFIGIFLITQDTTQFLLFSSYALLIEGALALIAGGVIASFSSTFGKLEETIFHHEAWDAKRQKEAEVTARSWIIAGIILFISGLFLSAV